MEIITNWVSQIIIFLLLAAVIDLLIPTGTMQKYIRLVVGLTLMLIFLKPVFYLFHIDMETALESSFTEMFQDTETAETIENGIEMKKVDIQASQDAYILEQMTFQLIEIAKTPLQEEHHVEIYDIEYHFSNDQEGSYENLEEVIVYLIESADGVEEINVVDEVIIGLEYQDQSDLEERDTEEIETLLQDIWEIGDKKLTIKMGGGAS